MRVALLCILAAAPVFAEGVTIVLEFDGPKSDQSIAEMKREFAGIMKETALRFEFQSRTEASQTTTSDSVVLVKFKGKCRFEPVPYLSDERGPLAFTLSTSGEIQPFSEVECDRVAQAVRPAMAGGDFARGDILLGRALGRVLAHEVVHILAKTGAHGTTGVAKPALSGRQLIAPELRLEPDDVERIAPASSRQ